MSSLVYRRVLVKLSGETLPGPGSDEQDLQRLGIAIEQISAARAAGAQLAVVVGAGNLIRGKAWARRGLCPRRSADVAGMLATVMNGILLKEALEGAGCPVRLFSMIGVDGFVDRYSAPEAERELAAGTVVVLAGGTGMPYLTTDTAAALLALQIGAQALLKATQVDGVYEDDPVVHKTAAKIETLGAEEVLARRLGIMDLAAVALCGENNLPVIVCSLRRTGALLTALEGRSEGSIIQPFGEKKI